MIFMIEYKSGNILESKCQAIVIPTNIKGIQGAGLAKQARDKFPHWNKKYHHWCVQEKSAIGKLHVYTTYPSQYIIGFPTKKDWRFPSKLIYIEIGLDALVNLLDQGFIYSIAIPKLGCGLGGLNWEKEVKPLIKKYLGLRHEHIDIYE